jgi:hypothetical protein
MERFEKSTISNVKVRIPGVFILEEKGLKIRFFCAKETDKHECKTLDFGIENFGL